jgi:hypothetical protein
VNPLLAKARVVDCQTSKLKLARVLLVSRLSPSVNHSMSSDLSRVYVAECGARCEFTAANYSARSETGGQPYTDMTTASVTTAGGSPVENFTGEAHRRHGNSVADFDVSTSLLRLHSLGLQRYAREGTPATPFGIFGWLEVFDLHSRFVFLRLLG